MAGPRPEKREAILAAGRAVFGRSGYAGASTERIAAVADVSTRTLYKHFPSKEALFAAVLTHGAQEVADAFEAEVAAIDLAADPERVVEALGWALTRHRLDFPEHFAVTRHADLDEQAMSAQTRADWRRLGPARVHACVRDALGTLGADGRLDVDDADEVADQLILLIAGAVAFLGPPGAAVDATRVEALVARGTRTFLRGYS